MSKETLMLNGVNHSSITQSLTGIDGYSPTIEITEGQEAHNITITDKNGIRTTTISDGTDRDDTSITVQNIANALGYIPADAQELNITNEHIIEDIEPDVSIIKNNLKKTTTIIKSVNLYKKSTSITGSSTIESDYIRVDSEKTIYFHRNNSSGYFGNYAIDMIEEYININTQPIKISRSTNNITLGSTTKYIKIKQSKSYSENICISYRIENEYTEHFDDVVVPNTDCVSLIHFNVEDYIAPILSILAIGKTVFVPKGIWETSPFKLRSGDTIIGENINYPYYEYNSASALVPKQACDVFIDATGCTHIRLEIILANYKMSNENVTDTDYASTLLKLNYVRYSTFKLILCGLVNNGLTIQDSWELNFDKLYFRRVLRPNTKCVRFKKSSDPNYNISQNFFNDVQAEGMGCTIFYAENECRLIHCIVNSILYEGTVFSPFERTQLEATINIPLIYLEHANTFHIGTIMCNNLKTSNGIYDNIIYCTNNFIEIGSGQYLVRLSIDNFIMDAATNSNFVVIKSNSNVNSKSYVIIKNLEYDHTYHHSIIKDGLNKAIVNDLLAD